MIYHCSVVMFSGAGDHAVITAMYMLIKGNKLEKTARVQQWVSWGAWPSRTEGEANDCGQPTVTIPRELLLSSGIVKARDIEE